MGLVVGHIAAGDLEIQRDRAVPGHREDVEQLLEVGPMVLVVTPGDRHPRLLAPLFFLSGVFGALTFQTPAVQAIGAFQPVHYAIVLEQMAFRGYGTGTLPLGADAAILGGYLAVFAVLAAAALRFSGRAIRKAG